MSVRLWHHLLECPMNTSVTEPETCDLFVLGGGINGCGIARDAAGRGLSVVLAEKSDLASATSSASTKLFHGGLRYLEYFKIRLVREALIEREILLKAMPHISRPMRFVLPYHADMRFDAETPMSRILQAIMPWMKGRRPGWLIRLGLFLYDHLGGRDILPGTSSVDLTASPEGKPLHDRFMKAYEYSDCWVEDARLVVLNARDAEIRGARILVQTEVVSAVRENGFWKITLRKTNTGEIFEQKARALVNAGGPWVGDVLRSRINVPTSEGVRLVRGSHIVTKRLFDHDKSYFFQGEDGRIIFAIPYETDFTLIGTTDQEHLDANATPVCTEAEQTYLCAFASRYFRKPVTQQDVVWTYSGVRPLYDDGASNASAATRDYVLTLDDPCAEESREAKSAAPLLNVFGGKITTYRKLAESALQKLAPHFPNLPPEWTAGVPLPGGDFAVEQVEDLVGKLQNEHKFLTDAWAKRLIRAYGTEAWHILRGAKNEADLGGSFGATLTVREVIWLIEQEYACCAEDVIWRRSKLGLRLSQAEVEDLENWMGAYIDGKTREGIA